MHGHINVKSPNNISKWQMGFNSAFKGLMTYFLNQLPITFQFGRSRVMMRLSHIREVISLEPSWVQKMFSVPVCFLSPCEKTPEVKPQNFFLSVHLSNGSKYLLFNSLDLNKTYI
jgi:hypothetical protein